jgi:hypothetical protein
MGWYGLNLSGPRWRPVAGFCEHSNEPSGSIKFWDVLEKLGALSSMEAFIL